ncbi:hypothetical protein ElyMa_004173100 [Elysia marginata]|uniref:Uncharacterized protein n=1 Tax=Elysia marginata TaxID=1093978 RepID=A0AAV4GKC9_9GAST|nr:hypothetical protein ElyMa_004173100 [Elysia marginata]
MKNKYIAAGDTLAPSSHINRPPVSRSILDRATQYAVIDVGSERAEVTNSRIRAQRPKSKKKPGKNGGMSHQLLHIPRPTKTHRTTAIRMR